MKKVSKLVKKIVIVPITIVFITTVIVALIFSSYISNETVSFAIKNANASLGTVLESFDNVISNTQNLAYIFSNSFEAQGGDFDSLLLNLKKVLKDQKNERLYIDSFVSDYSGSCKDVDGNEFYLSEKTNELLMENKNVIEVMKSSSWENGGLPILRIGVPINIFGNFQGGVFFDLYLSNEDSVLYNLVVKKPKIANSGYGFALTPNGTTIIHENVNFIWDNITKTNIVHFETQFKDTLPNILKYTLNGKEKLAVGKTDPLTGLKLYVTTYTTRIVTSVKKSYFYVFTVFILLSIFLAFILFVQIRPIAKDILNINDAMKKISDNEYDIDLKTSSSMEIETIAKNLTSMAKEIKNHIEQIKNMNIYIQNILDSLNTVVVITNSEGFIEFYNKCASNLFGEDLINGASLSEVIDKNNINVYFDPNSIIENEESFYFPDVEAGSKFFDVYLKFYKTPIFKGILFTANDVSKRIELESHISQIQRIETIGLMVSGIAHDFNNFLGSILGYVELMEVSKNPEEKSYYFEKIYSAVNDAKKMIAKLLIFTSSESVSKSIIKVDDAITKAIDMVKNDAGLKSIDFKLMFSDMDLKVEMNETEFIQMITNLAINSIQAIEKKGTITVKTELSIIEKRTIDLDAGRYVRIVFNDNGPGITDRNLEKLFDPFFTTKKGGSGLGLYVVHSIANKNGGKVKVYSKLGIGTTFEIYLPLYTGGISSTIKEPPRYVYGEGQNILIVDDDDTMRNVVKRMLEKLHYVVYDADGVDSAWKILKDNENRIDLILLDVVMPEKDATELMEYLKNGKFDIPVILVSGFTQKLSDITYYSFYKEFLPKPFNMKTLSFVISKYVRRKT